jgi:TetR/AcrR family transcriptional regulator, cholesterol catabolism regulator
MTQEPPAPAPQRILAEVISLLESGGPNAVVLRDVARRARVSLREVYKHFGSGDELIVAAVAQWMDSHVYQPLAEPVSDGSLFDALIGQFRHIFEPWEENPRMLESFVYARSIPSGDRLLTQGEAAATPVMLAVFQDLDPAYAEDVLLIVTNLVYALMGRVAAGQLPITAIMPTIERVLRRLTADVDITAAESSGSSTTTRVPSPRGRTAT